MNIIPVVHVITKKRLLEFATRFPVSRDPLLKWYRIVSQTDFASFMKVRSVFRAADQVGKFTVFDIGGNKFRIIAAIHYNRRRIYIRYADTCGIRQRQMEGQMMLAKQLIKAGNEYRTLRSRIPLGVIRSKAEYERAVAALDAIIDEIGEDETHPLADLAEALGVFIEAYDNVHHSTPAPEPREMLRFLMAEKGLKQSDLPELGSQGVVSEILSGKRSLNIKQVSRLAKRFNVSPAVFLQTGKLKPR